jgi:hypothetical protein
MAFYGPGVYTLDLGYDDEASRQQLRWECFGESRAEHPMDGVLVIDPGLAETPFAYVEGRIWLRARRRSARALGVSAGSNRVRGWPSGSEARWR